MKTAFTAAQAAAFRVARQHLAPGTTSAPGTKSAPGTVHAPSASARRASAPSIVDVCRDTAGIQAQIMSQAEIAIWTRRRATTIAEIDRALWERRDVVRVSAMRLTLHLVPASDFTMYIEAMKPVALGIMHRALGRLGAKPAHISGMMNTVVDALADGPKTQQELIAVARSQASRAMQKWLKIAWSAVRPAVVEGLICYGPPRGSSATFVRADQWLPKQRRIDRSRAQAELLRRFLGAFGPASLRDFTKWSLIRGDDAKAAWKAIEDELLPVTIDGAGSWVLADDREDLERAALDSDAPRLLPAFDAFLLAHATKEHLVDRRNFTRVYRPQGWISPVILVNGRVVGVWFPKATGKRTMLDIRLFDKPTRALRTGIEREAEALGTFLGTSCALHIT